MIPEAVGFSFVAGVNPIVGLWSAVVMGFFAAAFGGRPGIITGASGACAVVVTSLVAAHGPSYLSGCVLLAGVLQLMAGLGGEARLFGDNLQRSALTDMRRSSQDSASGSGWCRTP